MNQHLGVPINPLVKLLIRDLRVLDPDLVTHDEGRLRRAGDDEVAQVAVVLLYVALARGEGEALW